MAIFASTRRRRRLSVAGQKPRNEALAVEADAARQVDDDLQPFVKAAAGLTRSAERVDEPGRIEGEDSGRACSDDAVRRIDPADRGFRPQGIEIVYDENQSIRRIRAQADAFAERCEKCACGRGRPLVRIEEIRARRAGLRLAARPPGRRLGDFRCGVRVGGERGDALAEAACPSLEVASPIAQIMIEELRSAKNADPRS